MLRRALLIVSGLLFVAPVLAQEKAKDDQPVVKKKATRESLIARRDKLLKVAKQIRALADEPAPTALTADQKKKYAAIVTNERLVADEGVAVAGKLTSGLEDPKANLDSLSDLGEAQQLKMQTTMDRLAKAYATVSNLLKKMHDSAEQIVQNLK